LETKATLSSMTRVLSEIEAQESYVFGVTPVAFVGKFPAVQSRIPHTEKYIPMQNGMEHSFSVSFPVAYQSYFSNVLQYPITLYDTDATNEIAQKDIVKSMPVFPAKGSVQTIDGVIVVKMGEP
ncbi:MAG: hypothetical protein IKI29_00115, partial [Clostridia bacterium]|nr:hypothetical protein [Clostridia bacterium]